MDLEKNLNLKQNLILYTFLSILILIKLIDFII